MAKYQNGKMLKGWKVKRSKEQKIKGQKVKIPRGKKVMELYNHIDKGLYINNVILFLAILDTPLPPVIMSSFDIPPTPPPDDVIYVQDNRENL